MKKLFAILVCVAMLAALQIPAMAEYAGDPDDIPIYNAGANSGNTTANIQVNVGTITHMYCVDITFEAMNLNFGNLTWDVNDLVYKGTTPSNTDYSVVVENRSDLAVKVTPTVTDSDANDLIVVASTAEPTTLVAVASGAATGTKVTYTASVTSTNWIGAINYYQAKGTGNYNIGTITIAIAKVAP